ncbi:hypothetical protein IFM89_018329 [Coptis chinensis]|uniref:Uncharacterized protein n=1 Tax=Coptis chinensis TaxID=261450 RepID=A0A835GZM8_9MAGN|nr:hypothetical protein IFM89_018329 [Coptis chinensis]
MSVEARPMHPSVNMDTHYSPGRSNSLDDDQLNEDMGDDATNISGSSTNRKGQPVTPIDVVSEFGTRLGYIARRDFPVCYEDWRHIDEDPSLVKEVAPHNIPLEDWHKFVDYCNTDKFKAMSARNKLNHESNGSCLHLLAKLHRYSSNELALRKNSIKNHISEHPESQYDLSGDAIATVVGPDKRGRFRGLGTGVCKTVLRKGDSLMKKNDGLMEANTLLERRMETMEANMDAKMSRHMEEVRGMFMSQRGTFNDNVPSPHSHASHHSTAPSLGVGLFKLLDVALECIMGYIDDARDRDVVSLVCRRWQRFPRLESLKLKGKPRASMFNLIPEDWGGFSGPWIREIAEGFNCLKCLHFRRMIVMDEDLEILARSRGQMLQSLKLDKCSGFSTDGLLHVTCSCREIMDEDSGTFRESKESIFVNCNTLSLFSFQLENAYYIGKDCELRGGWPLEVVARGIVQDVDPNKEYGERTLEEGNFKVYVQVVRRPDAILPFPHNAWQRTLGQVVQGAVI